MATGLPRMNLNQRAQHGLLLLTVGGALASGLVLDRPFGAGASSARAWHVLAGFGALGLLGYHLLYLIVRGYVESRGWADFPLRWGGGDFEAALAGMRFLLGGGAAPPAGRRVPPQPEGVLLVDAGRVGAARRDRQRRGFLGPLRLALPAAAARGPAPRRARCCCWSRSSGTSTAF